MGKVHYFQRYKSYENTVTNNTLQLIARIYSYAPQKAAELINKLVDQDAPVEIGLEILQQSAGRQSVPDGVIVQRDWKIIIDGWQAVHNEVSAMPGLSDGITNLRWVLAHVPFIDTEYLDRLKGLGGEPLIAASGLDPQVRYETVDVSGFLRLADAWLARR